MVEGGDRTGEGGDRDGATREGERAVSELERKKVAAATEDSDGGFPL